MTWNTRNSTNGSSPERDWRSRGNGAVAAVMTVMTVASFGIVSFGMASCAQTNPRLDCGNGLLDTQETCDDGNREPGDGCDSDCRIEPGFSCFGEPSLCQTGCGDFSIAGLEECDDGNLLSGDGCDNACAIESGFTCTGEPSQCASLCGDGALASTEACDDGNTMAGDGCSTTCQVEDGWVCTGDPSQCEAVCGNNNLDAGEECDSALLDSETCSTMPGDFTGGTLACSAWCTFDIGGCISAGCGNEIIDSGEMCDDGNLTTDDGCTANCQVEAGWACTGMPSQCVLLCGNTTLDPGEDCDDALLGAMTCATVPGGFTDGTLGCTLDCQFNTSNCTTCGNNVPEPGEACEDGNTTAGDGCSPTCQVEDLPVLYWATGDPAVWSQMTITYAGDPHAPQTPIVAAANADQRDYAYVFTATTYHQLSLPGHQWIDHGSLNTRFSGVVGSQLGSALGISWPTDTTTTVALVTTTAQVYMYGEDNTTGVVTPDPTNPSPLEWPGDPLAPSPTAGRAAFQTLNNANGWTDHDVYSLCFDSEPSTPPGANVGPYTGIITTSDQLYLNNSSYCFLFYEQMPTSGFAPFTQSGAPTTAGLVATFYSTEHGNRLYVIIEP